MREMAQGEPWMPENHARAGEAHNLPDALTIIRSIAMDGALGANGLVFTPGAVRQAIEAILIKVTALRTKPLLNTVLFSAKQRHHSLNGSHFYRDL